MNIKFKKHGILLVCLFIIFLLSGVYYERLNVSQVVAEETTKHEKPKKLLQPENELVDIKKPKLKLIQTSLTLPERCIKDYKSPTMRYYNCYLDEDTKCDMYIDGIGVNDDEKKYLECLDKAYRLGDTDYVIKNHYHRPADMSEETYQEERASVALKYVTDVSNLLDVITQNETWSSHKTTSLIDDSLNISFYISSNESDNIDLSIRCQENETELYIDWDNFLSTSSINMLTRIDKQPADDNLWWNTSSDYKAVFYPGNDIEFIKSLFNHDVLLAKITPHGDNPITVTFDITELSPIIEPLRKACGW
jgi:hypothetical protein